MPTKHFQDLAQQLEGELLYDDVTRMLFASDASIYQQQPLAVAYPKSTQDCLTLLEFARQQGTALIPRAGGTSLAGQVVGPHLIVDTSRYLNAILQLDVEQRTARVQPGVIPAQLNQQLQRQRLMFAPDPSTLNRCTIGGMIGNNAWGAHCPRDGTTREHIYTITALLSGGDTIHCQPLDNKGLSEKQSLATPEGELYRQLVSMIQRQREHILVAYPDASQVPCNTGYALHKLATMQPWDSSGQPFNLSTLLCGSEGTLAIINEASVKLTPSPLHKIMLCPHFTSLADALSAVALAKTVHPAAIELLDQYLLRLTQQNRQILRQRDWIQGDPAALLIIEFTGDDAALLNEQANQLNQRLKQTYTINDIPCLTGAETDKAWAIRRASLGLLMGVTSQRKPVTFIEDSAVPVDVLPDFVNDIQQLMAHHATECVYYGSVSMGLIHLRPLLDLKNPADKILLNTLAQETAALIKRYHGSMSAKHGDGIVRGQFIRELLGDDIVTLLTDVKHLFDPHDILNPGKIINPQPIDQNLRLQPVFYTQAYTQAPSTFFRWRNDGGFYHTVEKCNGAGACRKLSSPISINNGTMCPSYMATHDEFDSTRGRANVFREVMQEHGFETGILHPALHSVLQNCLSCKACQSECPANVDMAKMKAEHLYHFTKRFGKSRQQKIVQQLSQLNHFASHWPRLANWVLQRNPIKSLLGVAKQRSLPQFARFTLQHWFAHQPTQPDATAQTDVVIFCDPFTNYYDVDAGIAAIEFLQRIGCRVTLSPCFASLRGLISQGLLQQAQQTLHHIIEWLTPHAENNRFIIGIEPSELLTLRDEAGDFPLSAHHAALLDTVSQQCLLFDEFVAQRVTTIKTMNLNWHLQPKRVYVHGHCHQKSLSGMQPLLSALSLVPELTVVEIASGCCGMAGLFGYDPRHYALSLAIAELVLFPTLRDASTDDLIVATGTSCRQQIAHGLKRDALHSAQLLRRSLMD